MIALVMTSAKVIQHQTPPHKQKINKQEHAS
jgi:hypothetical protein